MSVAEKMTAIADAIREKTGDTGKLSLDGMAEALRKLPGPIVATASGSPISLTDATDLKLRGLKLFGKTTQDGTPTPEAPVPLVSAGDGGSLGVTVAGKNLFNPGLLGQVEGYNTFDEVTGLWTTSAYTSYNRSFFYNQVGQNTDRDITKILRIPPNAKISCTFNDLSYSEDFVTNRRAISLLFFDRDGKFVGFYSPIKGDGTANPAGQTPENACYADIVRDNNSGQISFSSIQIEIGSTATEYEPYKEPQTLPVSTPNGLPGIQVTSGGNYTDENGQQWVCDEVDFGRGVYVQRVAVQHITSVKATNNVAYWKDNISQFMGNFTEGNADRTKPTIVSHGVNGGWFDSSVFYAGLANNVVFIVGGNRQKFGDTAESCNAYLAELNAVSPVQMLYALETPIETPLSAEELAAYAALHTNYPNTTILNDGGAGMEVQYVADTKLYIDNKINAMAAAIVNA